MGGGTHSDAKDRRGPAGRAGLANDETPDRRPCRPPPRVRSRSSHGAAAAVHSAAAAPLPAQTTARPRLHGDDHPAVDRDPVAGGIFSLVQVTSDAVDGLQGAIREAVPTAVAPTPVGSESGSLLRTKEFKAALAKLPAGDIHMIRVAPERIDAQVGDGQRCDSCRCAPTAASPSDHAGTGYRRPVKVNSAAPARIVRTAARRAGRDPADVSYLVLSRFGDKAEWQLFFTDGLHFSASATARRFVASAEPEEYIRTYLIAERIRGAQPSPFRGRRLPHRARQRRGDSPRQFCWRVRQPDRRDRAVRRRRRRRANLGGRDVRSRSPPAAAGGDGARETERDRRHPAGARRRQPDARQRRTRTRSRTAPAQGRTSTWWRRSCARACTTSPRTSTASCATARASRRRAGLARAQGIEITGAVGDPNVALGAIEDELRRSAPTRC